MMTVELKYGMSPILKILNIIIRSNVLEHGQVMNLDKFNIHLI